jgi:hypothetical protein
MDSRVSKTDPRTLEIALKRPEKFFKYTALDGERREWARNLVVDSALFFARPSMFNDPLDCRIPPSFEAEPADIEQFWREKWARQGRPALARADQEGPAIPGPTDVAFELLWRAFTQGAY